MAELAFEPLHQRGQQQARREQHAIGLTNAFDLPRVHSGAFHADDVDTRDSVSPFGDAERRHVLGRAAGSADQGKSPDAALLMDARVARQKNAVLDNGMTADYRAVGEDAMIADAAIVSDMR